MRRIRIGEYCGTQNCYYSYVLVEDGVAAGGVSRTMVFKHNGVYKMEGYVDQGIYAMA